MFDEVWNGEYNGYAVESRIIGEETLYSIEYTCWKVLVCSYYKERALLRIVLSIPIYSNIAYMSGRRKEYEDRRNEMLSP